MRRDTGPATQARLARRAEQAEGRRQLIIRHLEVMRTGVTAFGLARVLGLPASTVARDCSALVRAGRARQELVVNGDGYARPHYFKARS